MPGGNSSLSRRFAIDVQLIEARFLRSHFIAYVNKKLQNSNRLSLGRREKYMLGINDKFNNLNEFNSRFNPRLSHRDAFVRVSNLTAYFIAAHVCSSNVELD